MSGPQYRWSKADRDECARLHCAVFNWHDDCPIHGKEVTAEIERVESGADYAEDVHQSPFYFN